MAFLSTVLWTSLWDREVRNLKICFVVNFPVIVEYKIMTTVYCLSRTRFIDDDELDT